MKTLAHLFILLTAPIGLFAEPTANIPAPQKRTPVVDLARSLLANNPIESSEEELAASNPFDPLQPVTEPAEAGKAPVGVAVNNADLLKALAEGLSPSGTMQLGDRQVLLFGQKKVNVGDHIPVSYQGGSYELELRAIDRASFTLRLKNEEITRPIKAPVKKP